MSRFRKAAAIADAVAHATNRLWDVGTSPGGGASIVVTWPRLLARASTRATASETPPPLARLDA